MLLITPVIVVPSVARLASEVPDLVFLTKSLYSVAEDRLSIRNATRISKRAFVSRCRQDSLRDLEEAVRRYPDWVIRWRSAILPSGFQITLSLRNSISNPDGVYAVSALPITDPPYTERDNARLANPLATAANSPAKRNLAGARKELVLFRATV